MEGLGSEDRSALATMLKGIYPGTLWCGIGNIAGDIYNKLGKCMTLVNFQPERIQYTVDVKWMAHSTKVGQLQ